MLLFSMAGFVTLYALQRLQGVLPLNPQGQAAVEQSLAFNTSVSFVTNTNWQSYVPETTMGYLTQMAGLTVHNFVSAATDIALAIALIRGFARRSAQSIGNFWVDLTRCVLYILLPISIVVALFFVWQGMPQNLAAYTSATTLERAKQVIAQGPVASQQVVKMLGTNGGDFFNANSAHPFIDRADEIELVDLTPTDLIQRLKDGKVYVPRQAERAIRNYFQPGNLTALRELALPRTAQRVDEQMVAYMRAHAISGPWAATERVLVCVNENPSGAAVVRHARRFADRLPAPGPQSMSRPRAYND